jgi:hypothetical protein
MTKEEWELTFQGIVALGAISTAIMVFLAYLQVRAMRKGLEDTRNWNKMSTAFKIYPSNSQLSAIEEELNSSFLNLVDRSHPITESEIETLLDTKHSKLRISLKTYLNEFESYCAAINIGVVDERVAKLKYAHKIKRYYVELEPYIKRLRSDQNESSILSEFETVAKKWMKSSGTDIRY